MGVKRRKCVATELVCRSHDVSDESGRVQDVTAFRSAMHVARNKSSYVAKSGEERVYESVLLRRTYRQGGKVMHETLANLSRLPAEAVTALEAALKGQTLVPAGREFSIVRSLPHGHVAAVAAIARQLGLPTLLVPRCGPRAAAPAPARRAASRASTGCSPTRPGARSRCGCSLATPPTRSRSPRS